MSWELMQYHRQWLVFVSGDFLCEEYASECDLSRPRGALHRILLDIQQQETSMFEVSRLCPMVLEERLFDVGMVESALYDARIQQQCMATFTMTTQGTRA